MVNIDLFAYTKIHLYLAYDVNIFLTKICLVDVFKSLLAILF